MFVTLGYQDTKVIELRTLMEALASGEPASPNIDDWVMTARALDAVPQRRWVRLDAIAEGIRLAESGKLEIR